MDQKRHLIFFIAAFLILMLNLWITPMLIKQQPPAPAPKAEAPKLAKAPAVEGKAKEGEAKQAEGGAKGEAPKAAAPQIAAPAEKIELEWATLGSADPASPYRMLVTLTGRGAAVERIELNSPRYHEVENWEDTSGYWGELNAADTGGKGARVRVVGPGTPAERAGLVAGDVITRVGSESVRGPADLAVALNGTHVRQKLPIQVSRDGKTKDMSVTLAARPLAVVEPEDADPLSYLLTLERLDGEKIPAEADELPGLSMRTGNWKLLPTKNPDEATFQWKLPKQGLEVLKRFRLTQVPAEEMRNPAFPAYHLEYTVEVHNTDKEPHTVALRLDGPTGLPTEGSWYSYKISPNWTGGAGLRDVVVGFQQGAYQAHTLVSCTNVVDKGDHMVWQGQPVLYIGVDAQYFSSVMLPHAAEGEDRLAQERPIVAGTVPAAANMKNHADVSCRVVTKEQTLKPGGSPLVEKFRIFAGPKRPDLLSSYGLDDLVYYGMFGWVARPMLGILHFFYRIIPNYGIAIILLTVLVRSAMFPISRRQAMNAQKMQELQPEIKRIAEKYKGNMEARTKAQQELFRKHNYNPLAGCLPVFLQLPIFIGLYRSLSVDVELRQAPLLSESIRWCSNLSAPDMLWYWEPYLPAFLAAPSGWLGPYLNILPLATIGLFMWQQKTLMPPPTDEQSRLQQKMMQYMMIFFSLMFFKVASGLCLYFIASSLWGIAERKLLPKSRPPEGGIIDVRSKPVAAGGNGRKELGRRERGKK